MTPLEILKAENEELRERAARAQRRADTWKRLASTHRKNFYAAHNVIKTVSSQNDYWYERYRKAMKFDEDQYVEGARPVTAFFYDLGRFFKRTFGFGE